MKKFIISSYLFKKTKHVVKNAEQNLKYFKLYKIGGNNQLRIPIMKIVYLKLT